MNTSLSKLSRTLLSGLRQAPYLADLATRKSSFVGTENPGIDLGPRARPYESGATLLTLERVRAVVDKRQDPHQEQGPSLEDIEHAIQVWEAKIDLDSLTDLEKSIHNEHIKAIREKKEMYTDPVTGFMVYTVFSHFERGNCCGNACRHCPYNHENVASRYKSVKIYNGAFYC